LKSRKRKVRASIGSKKGEHSSEERKEKLSEKKVEEKAAYVLIWGGCKKKGRPKEKARIEAVILKAAGQLMRSGRQTYIRM